MPRIFVSHAAKDADLVENFVDLLQLGVNVHPDDVFCSSLPGMNIPTGVAFVQHIKSQIAAPEIVLLLISPEFLKSQFCNNEVGASWALSLPIYPLLVPPVDYADVRGVLDGVQVSKLNDKEKLNDLRDDLTEKFGLTAFRTSHWERKRDKFLAGLTTVEDASPVDRSIEHNVEVGASSSEPVSSTGSWLKLGDGIYRATKFEHRGSTTLHVEVVPKSTQDEAAFNRFRPDSQGFRKDTIPYAYQNDGGFARVDDVTLLSQADQNVWSFDLTIEETAGGHWTDMSYNTGGRTYTSDDIAELRAGRILIDDPPSRRRRSRGFDHDSIESMIFSGTDSKVRTDECILKKRLSGPGIVADDLIAARLEAVFVLKAGAIVDDILDLTLGPISGNKLPVRFRGVRQRYSESETISVEGECELGT